MNKLMTAREKLHKIQFRSSIKPLKRKSLLRFPIKVLINSLQKLAIQYPILP